MFLKMLKRIRFTMLKRTHNARCMPYCIVLFVGMVIA